MCLLWHTSGFRGGVSAYMRDGWFPCGGYRRVKPLWTRLRYGLGIQPQVVLEPVLARRRHRQGAARCRAPDHVEFQQASAQADARRAGDMGVAGSGGLKAPIGPHLTVAHRMGPAGSGGPPRDSTIRAICSPESRT